MTTRSQRIVRRLLALGALGLAACATPGQIQQNAYQQELKAQQLQAAGDYYGAAKAREAAAKQRQKAASRASGYYYY
jgi:hypothetical protein